MKKRFDKKTNIDNKNENQDGIVYRTKSSRPASLAEWQLLLKAMADCYDYKDQDDYKNLVDTRYQELKHKQTWKD